MGYFFSLAYDRVMAGAEEACLRGWREEVLEGLKGDVLEVGAGTGANLEFYRELESLVISEPDSHMRELLLGRVAASEKSFPVTVSAGSGESIPFGDASFDVVVVTLVLCTVRDLDASLAEIRRVLRPGGELRFIEHVVSEDAGRRRWQKVWNPVWRAVAGGCNTCRDTHAALLKAGFEVESMTRESMRKAVPIVRPSIRGIARLSVSPKR